MGIPEALRKPLALMFVAYSLALAGVSFGISTNTRKISDGLRAADYESCLSNVQSAHAINTVLSAIIRATNSNTLLRADEKKTRIEGYTDAMQTRLPCVKPEGLEDDH